MGPLPTLLSDLSPHSRTTYSPSKFLLTTTLTLLAAVTASHAIKNNITQIGWAEVMVWMGLFVCSHPCASAIPLFSTLISHSLIIELRITCGGYDRQVRLTCCLHKKVFVVKKTTESHDLLKDLCLECNATYAILANSMLLTTGVVQKRLCGSNSVPTWQNKDLVWICAF